MNVVKTVIFDFDGTLADSLELIIEIAAQLIGRTEKLSDREVAAMRHLPLLTILREVHVPLWRLPFMLNQGRRIMRRRIDEVSLVKGADDVVKQLHAAGFELLLVSTNSAHNIRAVLKRYDIEQYFSHIYGGVGLFSKTAALRKILRRNRLQPGDCIYIGDETRDIEACQALGLRCIAVEWGLANPEFLAKHGPFALVRKPDALLDAVRKA